MLIPFFIGEIKVNIDYPLRKFLMEFFVIKERASIAVMLICDLAELNKIETEIKSISPAL